MALKLTWLGQSTFVVETGEHRVLIDPWITDNPGTQMSAEDIEADFILISHGHQDEVGDAAAIAKRSGALCIGNSNIMLWLKDQGVENVHPQNIGGGHEHPFGHVKMTIAHHTTTLPDGADGGVAAGFLITFGDGIRLYFAGDTGLFMDMQLYGAEGIDVAIVPIGDNFTMGPDDAIRAVKFLRPKVVIPMHYNTFALIEQDGEAWVDRVIEETDSRGVMLKWGDSVAFEAAEFE